MRSAKKKYLIALGIWCAVCVAVLLGTAVLVILPQEERLADLQGQVDEVAQRLANAQNAAKPETKARLHAELTTLRDRLCDFTVDSEAAASLTFQIGQLADAIQVGGLTSKRKEGFSQDKLEGFQLLGEIWLDVSFQGDFSQFAQFINRLERHRPVVFVEKFNIERDPHEAHIKEVEVSLCFLVQSKPVAKL